MFTFRSLRTHGKLGRFLPHSSILSFHFCGFRVPFVGGIKRHDEVVGRIKTDSYPKIERELLFYLFLSGSKLKR